MWLSRYPVLTETESTLETHRLAREGWWTDLEAFVLQHLLDRHQLWCVHQLGLVHDSKRPIADHFGVCVAHLLRSVGPLAWSGKHRRHLAAIFTWNQPRMLSVSACYSIIILLLSLPAAASQHAACVIAVSTWTQPYRGTQCHRNLYLNGWKRNLS